MIATLYYSKCEVDTGERTWTFIPFRMCDKNTTVPKRAAHPHFDWPSDGSCQSQALSQLSAKLAQLLAGTIYGLQLPTYGIQCTVHSVQYTAPK